ncbi:DUF5672 family protein [Pedobacter sandarakinus]|uniref:DUF5672 family protein n=1 Tax=Pedobacter sandarakinus TaxID=353156 RepID=UPI002247D8F5|nr:DUF5672 family protein [Pedobacter sandarakinus]MCX2573425.1 DUF5672 family protein [Pedobacter sandarakinus]
MKKVAIVIPFYKQNLSAYEKISLQQCQKTLSRHDIVAIKPDQLLLPSLSNLIEFDNVINFSNHYFQDIAGYNRLMLSAEFYKAFLNYEYILVYQMDCFVFYDGLSDWCNQNWDYIGAPWIKKTYHKDPISLLFSKLKRRIVSQFNFGDNSSPNQRQLDNQVGNGGFSLRRVAKFHDLCLLLKPIVDDYLSANDHLHNEDVFWSIEVNREQRILHIPSCTTALKFAVEVPPIRIKNLTPKDFPFGCHDWDKYADYWRPVFKTLGYNI